MNVVFMGTPDFAVPSLKKLIESDHNVELVVTQPDKKGNRGKVTFSPVKEVALANDIEVSQPIAIRHDEEFMAGLEALNPDIIVVAAFGQILPKRVLDAPKYGCINVHGSLLPKLRGAAPMQYSILQGDEKTGVTIMQMATGLDTGDMITKAELVIGDKDINQVADELSALGADLLLETMDLIERGEATFTPQDDAESTYAHMIKKSDGLTDFSGSAVSEWRKARAFNPWPALYSYLDGNVVKFYNVEPLDEEADGPAGTVSAVNKNDFTINCGEGKLRVLELQLQGKKRMNAGDFLRGRKLNPGDCFKGEV